MAINDLWSGWFGEGNPLGKGAESAYFSNQNQWKTPNQKKFFQSQFGNIQDQYMGRLGQMVQGGGAPSMEFADFLKNFNWGQSYNEQAPRQDTSRYNPWTRWMT